MAVGAFLLVAGALLSAILYLASTNIYTPNQVPAAVYGAVIAAAVGAAVMAYGLSSRSH